MELFFSALIIFCLRLADQSLGTMRNLLVNKSKPLPAALIGLVESAIWLLAVSEVIKDIYDPFFNRSICIWLCSWNYNRFIYRKCFRSRKM